MGGWRRGTLEQMEGTPARRADGGGFSLGQDGPGLFLLVADGGGAAGAVVLPAHNQEVGLPGDGGFDDGPPTLTARRMASRRSMDSSPVKTKDFLVEGVVGVKKRSPGDGSPWGGRWGGTWGPTRGSVPGAPAWGCGRGRTRSDSSWMRMWGWEKQNSPRFKQWLALMQVMAI